MTKVELLEQIMEASDLKGKEAEKFYCAVTSTIQDALNMGQKVSLIGLGVFIVTNRKARMGRNPRTGEPVPVPEKKIVKFRASKELKDLMK